MAPDHTARAEASGEPSLTEYDAIHDTMMASARGRWFLNEYARRNRSADTNAVLHAIDQIGAHLRGEALPPEAPEYLHLGLTTMAALVAAVEADISALSTGHESATGAKPRVARVISTLRDLGDCIQVMLDGWKTPTTAFAEPPVAARAVVPPLALVQTAEAESVAMAAAGSEPEPPPMDYESDFVPFEIDVPEETTVTATADALLPAVEPLGPGATPQTAAAADLTLAELRALNRNELVALFS